jgi:predicted acylesterase/phospholipase RssA
MRFLQLLFTNFQIRFDMVGGISAGALTGALIAYNKWESMKTLLQEDMFKAFFDPPCVPMPLLTCKYLGNRKRELLQRCFGTSTLDSATIPFLTATYNWTRKAPEVFSSLSGSKPLVEILNASTAACTYFPPVTIEDCLHIDSGVVMNNPSLLVYTEAYRKWPTDELYMLSLGCGNSPAPSVTRRFINYSAVDWAYHGILGLLETGPNQIYET